MAWQAVAVVAVVVVAGLTAVVERERREGPTFGSISPNGRRRFFYS